MPVVWDDFEPVDAEVDWSSFEDADNPTSHEEAPRREFNQDSPQFARTIQQLNQSQQQQREYGRGMENTSDFVRAIAEDPSQIPSAIKQTAMLPFGIAGQFLNTGMQDIGQWVAANWTGEMPERSNLLEWMSRNSPMEADIPLPYQQTLKDISASNPITATAGKLAAGTVEAAPMIAAGIPGGIAGRTLSAMFAADMAAQAGTGAGTIAGEMDRPPEQRDWDAITTGAAEIGLGAMAPLAAAHAVRRVSAAAPPRKSAAERQRRLAKEYIPEAQQAAYEESLSKSGGKKMSEPEAEELFQLKQAEKSGKLSVEDSHRLSELEKKAANPESHLDAEEQSYIDAEREGMSDHSIEVVQDIEPGSPFSGQVATINRRTNSIRINPAELSLVLRSIPKERRANYVKSLLAEESIHLKTADADAKSYWDNLTWAEKQIVKRRYTGELSGKNPHGGEISDVDFGHEAMRAQIQRLQGMDATEIASTVGARRMTMQALVAVESAILNVRKALGTKASREQTRILDEVSGKIATAKGIIQKDESAPASIRQGGEEKQPDPRWLNAATESKGVSADIPPEAAKAGEEIGFSFKPAGTVKMEGLPKEMAEELQQVNEKYGWEFTDKRPGSPTMGLTFYTKKGATRQEIMQAHDNKQAEVSGLNAESKLKLKYDGAIGGRLQFTIREEGPAKGAQFTVPKDAKLADIEAKKADTQKSFEEGGPAAIRQGGPSKRGQEIAEQKRRIAEMQARARGEELAPEHQTKKQEPQFAPVSPEERVGTEASAQIPLLSAKELESRAAQELSKDFRGADDRPSFDEFSSWAKRNMEGVQPEQLRSMWEDKVWSHLLSASGERLKQIQKALGITTVGRTPFQIRRGLRTDINIADQLGKPSFNLELGIDKATREAEQKSVNAAQRHRNKVISAVARKLIGESVGGRASLERDSVGMDDIDFSNDKTKQGAYTEISRQDLADPAALNAILRDQARGSSVDPESASKRLVAVVDSSGKVHLVSTYNDAGVQRVADPAGTGMKNRPSRVLNKAFLNQYRPFASVLISDPVRGFRQTFATVSEFMDKIGKEASDRAKVSDFEPVTAEGPAPADLSIEGTPGIEGQGGYLMGPRKGEINETGHGSLESPSRLTDAEATGVVSHIMDEVGGLQTADDVRLSLTALTEKAASDKLTPQDRVAISGYRKMFDALEAKNRELPQEELLDMLAAKIYEEYTSSKTTEDFVKRSMETFGAGRAEAAQARAEEVQVGASPEKGGKLPYEYVPKRALGEDVRTPTDTAREKYLREKFIGARGESVGYARPLSEMLLPEAGIRSNLEAEAAGGKQLSEAARRRAIEIERQRIYRKQGVLPSYAEAEKVFDQAYKSATDEGAMPGSIRQRAKKVVRQMPEVLRDFGSIYDSWMVDRIEQHGGPVSKEAAQAFRGIIDREKQLYGELTPLLDKARELAGGNRRMLGVGQVPSISGIRAVNWANKLEPIRTAPFAAVSRVVKAIENKTWTPPFAQMLISTAQKANLEIGRMMQSAIPGFKAGGKFERNVTSLGYDIIRKGPTPIKMINGRPGPSPDGMWEKWTAALARANKMKLGEVRKFFRKWKAILDSPDSDAAAVMSVHQDFVRRFSNVVTHIKDQTGRWEPVLHADLFNYLENAARRATHAKAFREEWPHTTKGRQDLAEFMKKLRKELPPEQQKDVNALMLTMQGHPTDNYSSMGIMGPTAAGGSALRLFNQTIGNAMSKMALTGQLFVQPGEVIAGSTPVFLGYKNMVRGMAKLNELYPQLELQGSVNRVVYDFTLDRNAPIRSAFKAGGNLLSKMFVEQSLNEFQEATAAATAFVVSERIQANTLSAWEKRMLPETFKAMGFTADEVMGLMQGDANLLGQFQRKAAAFLTSGNRAISEGSRLGANRLFNSIFRFQSYPMMKANQLRRVTMGLAEAWQDGNAREKRNASEMAARFLFGNTVQGALTIGITALAYQGMMGLKIKKEEAQDEPLKFLAEAFLSTISGPLYMAWRGYKSKGVTGIGENATRAAFPYTVVSELGDFARGTGRYKDLSAFDKIGEFLKSKTPGTKAIGTGMALFGLSENDQKLDASIDAFYRWRRDVQGWEKREGVINEDERKDFRTVMKRAVEALKDGNEEKFNEAYSDAFFLTDKKGGVSQSMKERKILKSLTGGDLTEEQMDSLRQRIGDDAVDRLEYFDLMVDEAAKGALLPKYDE